jgi:CSLREA domain-containing protein
MHCNNQKVRLGVFVVAAICAALQTISAAVFNIADGDVAALKSAIAAANTNAEDDVIELAPGGSYSLTIVETNVGGNTGLPVITADSGHSTTIHGDRTTIQRASNSNPFRIFQVASGANVTLSGLVVSSGDATVASTTEISEGGGVLNLGALTITNCVFQSNRADGFTDPSGKGGGAARGGGISNGGTLSISDSTLAGNSAQGGLAADSASTPGQADGGGLANQGTVTISRTTFSTNGAAGGQNIASDTGAQASGGAIVTSGSLTVANCTLASNNATAQNGAAAIGGAIHVAASGSVRLTNCTISNNQATSASAQLQNAMGAGGVDVSFNGTATARNTIIAANTATASNTPASALSPDVHGTFVSEGHNFIGTTFNSSGWVSSDFTGTNSTPRDPKLRPLNYNLGPTQTMALQPTSDCINSGDNAVLADPFDFTTDQRGQPRKIGLQVDIGAFEFDATFQNGFLAVNKFDDHDDGTCSSSDCTLREALNKANATSGPDAIVFAPFAGTMTITLNNAAGVLTISDSVTIFGPGARLLTISGNQQHTVFTVTAGTNVISGVTIANGTKSSGSAGETNQGGGIFNQATLTLNDCALVANTVVGATNSANGGPGGGAQGGGIYNGSQLTLNGCTFSSNSVQGAPGTTFSPPPMQIGTGGNGGSAQGSGLFNAATAFATINNCTFNGNTALGGTGGSGNSSTKASGGDGRGAIFDAGGTLVTSVTISGNTGTGGKGFGTNFAHGPNGGGTGGMTAATSSQQHTVRNTIIAANTGTVGDAAPDADGAFTSSGYNLIGVADQSTGFTATADQVGTASSPIPPQLDSLKNNGGGTSTMALLAGSRALDAGLSFNLSTDQRGLARIQDDVAIANAAGGDGADIGAFELAVATPAPTPTASPTATATPTPPATPTPTPASQLLNLSTRKQVGTADNVLIGGFIVVGTEDKKVLLRGLGPSLPVSGALADPTLELHASDTTLLAFDDNWRDKQPDEINATGIPPTNELESAIVATLTAKPGSQGGAGYTGVLAGQGGGTGIGLLEIYDLNAAANSKLANISTRGFVGTEDDLLIGGFIPGPSDRLPIKVLVRALGPSLTAQGVSGALQDPLLELHDANGTLLTNDNWKDAANSSEIQATLPPPDDHESAIITTLAPSNSGYTAVVRGANGATGVALVEVYSLQ